MEHRHLIACHECDSLFLKPARLRGTVEEPVAQGYDALIEGHRRALEVVAEQLATSISSMRPHALSACAL
jgi:hypothetical protein